MIFFLYAASMFLGSIFSGFAPTWIASESHKSSIISIFGAGLLIGVSFLIIIPEGIHTLYLNNFYSINFNGTSNGQS